jgi:hypothetical protein
MTFLKKLGTVLAQGIAMATGLWPLVSGFFGSKAQNTGGVVINDLSQIGGIVVQAEALIQGPGTGPQKLANATPLIAGVVKTSEMISGHKIANEALFLEGCQDYTNGTVKILNSLDPGTIQTQGKPLPALPASAVPAA